MSSVKNYSHSEISSRCSFCKKEFFHPEIGTAGTIAAILKRIFCPECFKLLSAERED